MASLRGARSQKVLAEQMRDRGWSWAQATVSSVEKGERPLRLTEAEDLADLLGVPINAFLQDWRERLEAAQQRLVRLTHQAQEAARELDAVTVEGQPLGEEHQPLLQRVSVSMNELNEAINEVKSLSGLRDEAESGRGVVAHLGPTQI